VIKPINGMLLIKEIERGEEKTQGGLILSATLEKYGPKKGTIIVVGTPEINHFTGGFIPMDDYSEGDTVLYPDHTGQEVKDNNETYLLIHYKHIMAKITE
jgi:chaperonin GroES